MIYPSSRKKFSFDKFYKTRLSKKRMNIRTRSVVKRKGSSISWIPVEINRHVVRPWPMNM